MATENIRDMSNWEYGWMHYKCISCGHKQNHSGKCENCGK